jgi:hypothetical protein
MVPLLEARRDGRLGDRESASLDRHIGTCSACRAFEQDLDRMRGLLRKSDDARPTPLEHQRGRLALLRAAAVPPPPPRRLRLRAVSSLALAPTVLATVGAFALARHLPRLDVAPHAPHAGTTGDASTTEAQRSSAPTPGLVALPTPPAPSEPPEPPARPDDGAGALGSAMSDAAPSPAGPEPRREAPPMRAAVRMPGSTPRAPPGPEVSTSKAFGEAMDLLGRGDYAAAHARLDAFRAAHPTDARADLAAFLAIVSLQHAGRHAEAREAARRYLQLYPDGDRRADAAMVAEERPPSP